MIIRELIKTDYDQWRKLWRAYLEFYETSVDQTVYEMTFERLTSSSRKNQCALVAEIDKTLVGLVHYIFHPHNWKIEDVIYLQDLYTVPDKRLKGIGRALIETVYKIADENKTPSVYWTTQKFNHTARKLYDNIATLSPFIKYDR